MLVVDMIDFDNLSVKCKYSKDYVFRLKQVPGSYFNKYSKLWIFPYNSLGEFERIFKGEIVWKTPEWQIKSLPIPDVKSMYSIDPKIAMPKLKLTPYDYQEFGTRFMIDRAMTKGFVFNTDDCGLGKTIQASATMKYAVDNLGVERIIILCKKSIKIQWAGEIKKFTDLDSKLLIEYVPEGATAKQRRKIYDRCKKAGKFILITTYQSCMHDKNEFKNLDFDMMTIDEAHILRNKDGEMNSSIRFFSGPIKYKLFLTGTPLMTKPVDIYGLYQIADPNYLGPWSEFEKKHIKYEWKGSFLDEVGYKELDILRDKVQNVLIRRTDKEVSLQLPKIITKTIEVQMDKVQRDLVEAVQEKKAELNEKIFNMQRIVDNPPADMDSNKLFGMRQAIISMQAHLKGLIACNQAIADDPRLFHITKSKVIKDAFSPLVPANYKGSPKTQAIIDQVEEILQKDEKIVIYSKIVRYITVLKADLEKRLGIDILEYDGTVADKDRWKVIEDFTNDPSNQYPILLCSDAGAEG